MSKKINISKVFLYQEYIIKKKSTNQIAKEFGCNNSTIGRALKRKGIQSRNQSEAGGGKPDILTKEFLYKEYIINKKSTIQIAKEIGVCATTISTYLIKYSICRRPSGGSLKGTKAHNYQDGRSLKLNFCLDCRRKILWTSKKCMSCSQIERFKDHNHPNYIKDLIRDYPIDFNNILKVSIRIRDNHRCQICGKNTKKNGRKLDIHHIDYDKDNLNPENLITLCMQCHPKTSTKKNRETYIEFFSILKENKICRI